jgi:hypothetical protein
MSRMEYSVLKEKMKENECGWSKLIRFPHCHLLHACRLSLSVPLACNFPLCCFQIRGESGPPWSLSRSGQGGIVLVSHGAGWKCCCMLFSLPCR